MAKCVELTGSVDVALVEMMAACANTVCAQYDDPADLSVYDSVFSGDAR